MTKKEAKRIIDAAWSEIIGRASEKGDQQTRFSLDEAMRLDARAEKQSPMWSKAGIIETVLWAVENDLSAARLKGIRVAHQSAAITASFHRDIFTDLNIDRAAVQTARDFFIR